MAIDDVVELTAVEVMSETLQGRIYAIGERRVCIPSGYALAGSTARRPGERGTLALPRGVATRLALLERR